MKYLVDNQLPPALARFINSDLGAEASHVSDIGLRSVPDATLWAWASSHGFILVSKDEDFVGLFKSDPSTGLLWVRIGNCRRGRLLDAFRAAWPRIALRFENGDGFIELR